MNKKMILIANALFALAVLAPGIEAGSSSKLPSQRVERKRQQDKPKTQEEREQEAKAKEEAAAKKTRKS